MVWLVQLLCFEPADWFQCTLIWYKLLELKWDLSSGLQPSLGQLGRATPDCKVVDTIQRNTLHPLDFQLCMLGINPALPLPVPVIHPGLPI